MERERERNVSFEEYQARMDLEVKNIAERLKGKKILKSEEIDVQWNGHGFAFYPRGFPLKTVYVFYEDIPPGGHNIEHKHIEEAVTYIVKGRGHSFIGGSKDDERATTVGERIDWKAGDALLIPSGVWHVFYNDDEKEWARFLGIINPTLTYYGLASTHHHGHEGRSHTPPEDIKKAAEKK